MATTGSLSEFCRRISKMKGSFSALNELAGESYMFDDK